MFPALPPLHIVCVHMAKVTNSAVVSSLGIETKENLPLPSSLGSIHENRLLPIQNSKHTLNPRVDICYLEAISI